MRSAIRPISAKCCGKHCGWSGRAENSPFQDLFLVEAIYGTPDELVSLVKSWGIREVEFVKTCDAPFIPALLKLPFMVGRIGILYGVK